VENSCKSITSKKPTWVYKFFVNPAPYQRCGVNKDHCLIGFLHLFVSVYVPLQSKNLTIGKEVKAYG
jgi:hypothetical protein